KTLRDSRTDPGDDDDKVQSGASGATTTAKSTTKGKPVGRSSVKPAETPVGVKTLRDSRTDPGDDDDKMASGESGATTTAKSTTKGKPVGRSSVKPAETPVGVKTQDKLSSKSSQTTQKTKVSTKTSKKKSSDFKTNSLEVDKKKESH
ncbi:MAG TPA: hypothetical protein VGK57_03600, partial [Candidatus Binatia bacterium]